MLRIAVPVIVLALVAGTAAAFAVAEYLKLERSPVTAPRFDRQFSPVCECDTDTARLRVRFRRKEIVDAAIVDSAGDVVRRLAEDEPVAAGNHVFRWDGRDGTGRIAPDGRYRLRLHLEQERRTILVPTTVLVDTKAPNVGLVRVTPAAFSPDGDGRKDHVKAVYRSDEKGRPSLVVDGQTAQVGRSRGNGRASLNWAGVVDGEPVKAGTYQLSVRVRDLAGNLSEPTRPAPVRVRFIELDRDSYTVEAGGVLTFSVETDYPSFRWYLSPRRVGRVGRPVLFDLSTNGDEVAASLPADLEPGTYQLRVTAGGRKDRSDVLVAAPPL